MPFIVLALGALMFLAGSYEVYFGNTYIDVERGWSAFIAGTVLLTGGLVTIALGFALRALVDLKDVLLQRAEGLALGNVPSSAAAAGIGHDLAFPSAASAPVKGGHGVRDRRVDPLLAEPALGSATTG